MDQLVHGRLVKKIERLEDSNSYKREVLRLEEVIMKNEQEKEDLEREIKNRENAILLLQQNNGGI